MDLQVLIWFLLFFSTFSSFGRINHSSGKEHLPVTFSFSFFPHSFCLWNMVDGRLLGVYSWILLINSRFYAIYFPLATIYKSAKKKKRCWRKIRNHAECVRKCVRTLSRSCIQEQDIQRGAFLVAVSFVPYRRFSVIRLKCRGCAMGCRSYFL